MACLIIIGSSLAPRSARAVAPGVAGTLSIVPGLGQAINGDVAEGAVWFTSVLALMLQKNSNVANIGFKLWEYQLYDAYRDAGARDTAKHNVLQNYVAAFNPVNIANPISLGTLGYAGVRTWLAPKTEVSGPKNPALNALFYGFVGLGEEGLFRGFLFPGFSHLFDSYLAGAIVSSAAFSLSHLTNEGAYYHSALGLTELFLFGMVMSWQTYKKKFDLRESIFTHAWYDIIIDYGGKRFNSRLPHAPPKKWYLPESLGIQFSVPF